MSSPCTTPAGWKKQGRGLTEKTENTDKEYYHEKAL